MERIIKINPQNPETDLIGRATRILHEGGIIGYPTETVYGIGCNIYDVDAVMRIYKLKDRDISKAMIIIAADVIQIGDLVESIPDQAEKLIDNFWPGPLTIVFQASQLLQDSAFKKSITIAIRIPDSPICLSLLKATGFPLVSTSANHSGEPAAVSAKQVYAIFDDQLDIIIDGGKTPANVPSTVIDITHDPVRIIREGAISKLEIDTILETI